ncbi:MAG: FAD-dependent monooxygenase, partial [Methylobacter sp.]
KIEAYYSDRQYANANLNILANALYGVMSNDLLKTAVFKYLQCGGANAQESIAILAGLNKNHHSLIKQFFSVAFFGAYDLARKSIMNLPQSIKILSSALTIILPLAKNELSVAAVVSGYFKK